jgi:hypothetical protein
MAMITFAGMIFGRTFFRQEVSGDNPGKISALRKEERYLIAQRNDG